MKKYLLILGIGLLSTAAVTAAMLGGNSNDKEVKKEKKVEKRKECKKVKTSCFFS